MTTSAPAKFDAKVLLAKLRPWVETLVDDMRPSYVGDADLLGQHATALASHRTADAFLVWLDGELTQAAVAWVLAGVFVRFLEDQGFIDPLLTGPGDRHARASEAEARYFGAKPTAGFTDLWLQVFDQMRAFRATHMLFDRDHGPLWRITPSGDTSQALLRFWRAQDPDVGGIALRFDHDGLDTRFLGDLYQDLSEAARKRYALLQTPDFVEAFILDRTLEPAVAAYGLEAATLIDPTCGSGHFVLGAFGRLLGHWERQAPGMSRREQVLKALGAVAGVDLNPFAIAVARFRLMVAAMRAEGIRRLVEAPDYGLNLAVGDTLLCAPTQAQHSLFGLEEQRVHDHLPRASAHEDAELLGRVFGRRYTAVVGNPPYIVVRDRALNQAYRERYPASCHMKYSLGAPFTEVFFRLAEPADASGRAGFVGMITADSFMKREFGSKLIEQVLSRFDLTHVISTAGAYIPGHGTPTVILFGRDRAPVSQCVRVVMGIQGEPSTPDDPAKGLVWTAILEQVDRAGSESTFVSVADVERVTLAKHPWSIGGGGAADLKELIEQAADAVLISSADSVGITSFTLEDDVFLQPAKVFERHALPDLLARWIVQGEEVRDWSLAPGLRAIFPYDAEFAPVEVESFPLLNHRLWPFRTNLAQCRMFGAQTKVDAGLRWSEYGRLTTKKLRTPLAITFGEVATHNHFVLDRGGKVFNRTAPVIKLPAGASEDDHLGLLGLLNSSTACFWLKQVCFPKGGDHQGSEGARVRKTAWDERYAFNSTNVEAFPLPPAAQRPVALARGIAEDADQLAVSLPDALLRDGVPSRVDLDRARERAESLHHQMIAAQEELDWTCYQLYGLVTDSPRHPAPPPLVLGERAFEIALARRVAAGDEETAWFERHGSTPITTLPTHWPADYRAVVEQRLALIAGDPHIRLIEQPAYKRRWSRPAWADLERNALRNWVLDRLEDPSYWRGDPTLRTVRDLAAAAAADPDMQRAVDLLAGQAGADLFAHLSPLVASEAVPYLPALRYTDAGARKRAVWEETWTKQRKEDAGEEVGKIPAPPKYKREDLKHNDFWRLRGALDVPKERFISLPGAEKLPDDSLVVGWAGWNHLQRAQALVGHYLWARDEQAWEPGRLVPLLAGVADLLPWLRQWHHDLDPSTGSRPSEDVAAFLEAELSSMGIAHQALAAWRPVEAAVKRGRKKT